MFVFVDSGLILPGWNVLLGASRFLPRYLMKVLGKDFDSNILHVGCGNSQLGRLLHDAGFVNATWLHQKCLDRACDMLHTGDF